ncbi:hypothetical protein WICANDRAFT_79697 [Wickerhamomyces anomalus NRRL Y-366-8]|uniref:Uncharacterized protein n=1 Tax=Wickerhamomyces anomalus (strain ATCC 58044 / CBS 1984 / NCYC 433 / NRRL Y-366-8) TaxID=683960 RepID=A0A1E3P144_WICAA|nr:uncharacterized protein WICANDRAFT_79697 [Wickerhamomyces anomalus NRRL Y-366-8]ODQ59171.1 hypothetical protein WICANDRAFT_79697 [Wickerhamomyces anomalus NRRL Y-366-8]
MTSPHVSDSEDELGTDSLLSLSPQILRAILASKLENNSSFAPKSTVSVIYVVGINRSLLTTGQNSLSTLLKANIEGSFENTLRHSISPTIVPSINGAQGQNGNSNDILNASSEDLSYSENSRRATRRRNVSFYQQHIYTIDSVSYTLRMPLEDATELVKKRPEIIEMYHRGCLEKYLKNGFKLPEPPTARKTTTKASVVDEESTVPEDLESDEKYSSSSSQDSSSDESDASQQQQETVVKFRGHIYRDLDAVSRASGLPKSFFSMQKVQRMEKSVPRKRNISEYQVGIAKRKKAANRPTQAFGNDIFTTGVNSQENEISAAETAIDHEIARDSEGEVVEVGSASVKNAALNAYHDVSSESDEDDVMEIVRRERQLTPDSNLSMFQPTVEDEHVFHKLKYFDGDSLDGEAEVATSELDPMLQPVQRNHKKARNTGASKPHNYSTSSVRSRSARSSSARSLAPKRSGTRKRNHIPSLKRVSKPKPLHHPTSKILSNKVQHLGIQTTNTNYQSIVNLLKEDRPKKTSQPFFHITPDKENLLPRNAGASTLVYEGLSESFALRGLPNQQIYGEARGEVPKDFEKFNNKNLDTLNFKGSSIFKSLNNEELPNIQEAKVTFGKRTFVFSKLFGDSSEKLSEVFQYFVDPSFLKGLSKSDIIESVNQVLCFCLNLDLDEIRSLVGVVDSFKIRIESNIMKKGHVKDIEFYLLSICDLVYDICSKKFNQNHIYGYDFQSKVLATTKLYLEFACHLGGDLFCFKLQETGLFRYSMEIISSNSFSPIVEVLRNLSVPDMKFVEAICLFSAIEQPMWNPVVNVLLLHIKNEDLNGLRSDICYIHKFATRFKWSLTEELLSLVYEALKINRFNNFPSERSFPVIFSEVGINKDTSMNTYLNMLLDYSTKSDKPSSKFLEKIIPVSRGALMDRVTFCNRVNILLCLSVAFKRNFESRINELLAGYQIDQKLDIQIIIKMIESTVKINERNGFVSTFKSLDLVVLKCIEIKELDPIKFFFNALNFKSFKMKTQKNLIIKLSAFKHDGTFLKICEPLIRDYSTLATEKEGFESLKHSFGDISPALAPALWCCINGKLVSEDLANWSRLMSFSDFDDEPFIYTYILRHSGNKIYQLERETFIISLVKNLVGRRYSSSLNSYIREIEKFDSKLINTKGVLVQSQRFQLTLDLIVNVLDNESDYTIKRLLSSLVKFVGSEVKNSISEGNLHYKEYVKRIVEFLDVGCVGYLSNEQELDGLKRELGIIIGPSQRNANARKVNSNSLVLLEQKLFDTVSNKIPLDPQLIRNKLFKDDLFDISISSFYDICCFLSIHAELLTRLPVCWILLAKISESLSVLLQQTKSFSQMDIYCLAKTVKLFHYIFKHKNSNYYNYQLLSSINIYRILSALFNILDGTNDYFVLYDLSFVFMSTSLIFDNEIPDTDSPFLVKVPVDISHCIREANLPIDQNLNSEDLQRKLLHEYEKFMDRFKLSESSGLNDETVYGENSGVQNYEGEVEDEWF